MMQNLKKLTATLIACGLIVGLAAPAFAATVIDDFSAGNDFTFTSGSSTENFAGVGPIGGSRQIDMADTVGSNTTTLDTSAGTLSIATTGFAETFVRYGTFDTVNGSQLNLSVPGSESLEFVLDSFSDDPGNNSGSILILVSDGAGTILSRAATASELLTLDTNNGGVLTVALSSFSNFGSYNGEVDGIILGIDDNAMTAVFSLASIGAAPVPEPSTFALAALSLVGLGWFGVRQRKG